MLARQLDLYRFCQCTGYQPRAEGTTLNSRKKTRSSYDDPGIFGGLFRLFAGLAKLVWRGAPPPGSHRSTALQSRHDLGYLAVTAHVHTGQVLANLGRSSCFRHQSALPRLAVHPTHLGNSPPGQCRYDWGPFVQSSLRAATDTVYRPHAQLCFDGSFRLQPCVCSVMRRALVEACMRYSTLILASRCANPVVQGRDSCVAYSRWSSMYLRTISIGAPPQLTAK